jgi:hypothetical protein
VGESGAAPHDEEVGEGPGPIGKRLTAGNSPVVTLAGGTRSVPK